MCFNHHYKYQQKLCLQNSNYFLLNIIFGYSNLNRFRDFHSDFTQKNNWHNENAVKIKTLSPLHYKLYESSLQDVSDSHLIIINTILG